MRIDLHRNLLWTAVLAAVALPLAGCETDSAEEPDHNYEVCNRALSVAPVKADSRALIVTEPEALARLQLKDVLAQLINFQESGKTTPMEMMQRLFDTANDDATGRYFDIWHCDSPENPAHGNGRAAFCPRTEGKLAQSTGFFTPGDPDYFYPVAAVNRMDLMTAFGSDCGQHRIVFAKQSGLTDPNNRVFLILEAVLPLGDPDFDGDAVTCQSVAEFWQSLETAESAAARGDMLHDFFFTNLTGRGPVLTPANLGFGSLVGAGYYGTIGQVRLSQHMNDEWEYREFHLGSALGATDFSPGPLAFIPSFVGNNPIPSLFSAEAMQDQYSAASQLQYELVMTAPNLASKDLIHMAPTLSANLLAGESVLGGPEVNDYRAHAADNKSLMDELEGVIHENDYGYDLSQNCPKDDPMTAEAILNRATVQSCAGCHSPSQFLGPERKIGCGMVWPDSLDPAHIDEKGNISPALKEVFLPHRAQVLTSVLQACHPDDFYNNLAVPAGSGAQLKGLQRRTIGGSVTH